MKYLRTKSTFSLISYAYASGQSGYITEELGSPSMDVGCSMPVAFKLCDTKFFLHTHFLYNEISKYNFVDFKLHFHFHRHVCTYLKWGLFLVQITDNKILFFANVYEYFISVTENLQFKGFHIISALKKHTFTSEQFHKHLDLVTRFPYMYIHSLKTTTLRLVCVCVCGFYCWWTCIIHETRS